MDWQMVYNLKKLVEEYCIENIPFIEICEKGEGGIEQTCFRGRTF